MTDRETYFDGTEVGPGYCRVLRAGDCLFVSGTGSANEHGLVVGETVYDQTKFVYNKINDALGRVGSSLADVVRICAYVRDIARAEEFSKAHAEAFGATAPSATLVEVSGLVKGFKVEIEAQAIL